MPEASVDHLYYHVDRARLRIKVWPIIFLQRMPQNGISPIPHDLLWHASYEAMGVYVSSSWIREMAEVTLRLGHKRQTRLTDPLGCSLMEPSHHALRKPKKSQEKDTCQCSGQQLQLMSQPGLYHQAPCMWVNESADNSGPQSSLSSFQLRSQTLCSREKPSLLCPLLFLTHKIPWS